MPLEIRELVIRTQIVTEKIRQESDGLKFTKAERKAMIEECVEQVLDKLERSKDR